MALNAAASLAEDAAFFNQEMHRPLKSQDDYDRVIQEFLGYIQARGDELPSADNIKSYLGHKINKGYLGPKNTNKKYKSATILQMSSKIKTYCLQHGIEISADAFKAIQKPIARAKEKEEVDNAEELVGEEVMKFLRKPDVGLVGVEKLQLKQDKAVAAAAFGAGLRMGENKALKWKDVIVRTDEIMMNVLREKTTANDEIWPITRGPLFDAIIDYMQSFKGSKEPNDFFYRRLLE